MKFTIQPNPIEIEVVEGVPLPQRHGTLLPSTIRAVITGSSGSGKTNLIFNLLTNKYGLAFESLYIYSKSLNQGIYNDLNKIMQITPEVDYKTFANCEAVLHVEEADPNTVFIFDDVSLHKQYIIKEYFTRGRHSTVDSFYLCQSYSAIPKQDVRDNANFIVIFKQDQSNLHHIWKNHVNTDMSFQNFIEMCNNCWEQPYGFLVIDKDSPFNEGRYRRRISEFITL